MNTEKWLKRKYTKSHAKIRAFLNDELLDRLKTSKYRIGILSEQVDKYKTGTIIIWYNVRSYHDDDYGFAWDGTWNTYAIAKCPPYETTSGYHLFSVHKSKIIEVNI